MFGKIAVFVKEIVRPPIRIKSVHRIVPAVVVGTHPEVLVGQGVDGVPAADVGVVVACAGVACGVGVADPRADPRSVAEVGVCHRVRHRGPGQTAGRHRQVKDIVREFQGLAGVFCQIAAGVVLGCRSRNYDQRRRS